MTIEFIPKDIRVDSDCFFYINENDYIKNKIIFQYGLNQQNHEVIFMKINGKIELFNDYKKHFLNGNSSLTETIYRNDYYEISLRTKEIESMIATTENENGNIVKHTLH